MSDNLQGNDPELQRAKLIEHYKVTLAGHHERYKARLAAMTTRAQGRADLLKIGSAAQIEFGRSTLRGALILNGGGSLATTTMLAAVLQRGNSPAAVHVLAVSLIVFACGALLPVIATGFSYLSQAYFNTAMNMRTTVAPGGKFWRVMTILALCASGGCFACGILWNALNLPAALGAAVQPSDLRR